jgi:hypothetical protein
MNGDADSLLAALDAAPDNAARAALLAGRHPRVLEELNAALVYRKLNADVEASLAAQRVAFTAFEAELDAAADDAARLKVIEAARSDPQRGPGFVSEWTWQRSASATDWAQRYMAMLGKRAT